MNFHYRHCMKIACLAMCVAFVPGPKAFATIQLGDAANFGVISGTSVPSLQINNGDITGNIGIANPSGQFQASGPGTVTGNILFAGPVKDSISNTTITGTITGNNSTVTSAYNTLTSLSSTFAGETGTSVAINLGNMGTQTINATSGTLDSSGNYVFNVSGRASNLGNQAALTINGTASQNVVINVANGLNTLQGSINLTGGITSDNVLVNILGNTSLKSSGNFNTDVINATLLDLNGTINMNEVTINGRVFGGDSSNMQLVSNFYLNTPVTTNQHSTVPEPTSLIAWCGLIGVGLIGFGWQRRERRASAA